MMSFVRKSEITYHCFCVDKRTVDDYASLSFNPRVEFIENVTPAKYRLFQAADMIATLELIKAKLKTDGHITVSEKGFFESIQKLNRVYLKPLSRKLWE